MRSKVRDYILSVFSLFVCVCVHTYKNIKREKRHDRPLAIRKEIKEKEKKKKIQSELVLFHNFFFPEKSLGLSQTRSKRHHKGTIFQTSSRPEMDY
jgi:hypothetical protein